MVVNTSAAFKHNELETARHEIGTKGIPEESESMKEREEALKRTFGLGNRRQCRCWFRLVLRNAIIVRLLSVLYAPHVTFVPQSPSNPLIRRHSLASTNNIPNT